jgi:hypothetical protein
MCLCSCVLSASVASIDVLTKLSDLICSGFVFVDLNSIKCPNTLGRGHNNKVHKVDKRAEMPGLSRSLETTTKNIV